MRMGTAIKSMALAVILGVFLCGCGPKIEKYGDAPDESSAKTVISSILLDPQKYLDKEVVIEGTIASECPSGCWMNVRDGSAGTIHVEMLGNDYVPLPQRTGRTAMVKGKIFRGESSSKEIQIYGKGVLIK